MAKQRRASAARLVAAMRRVQQTEDRWTEGTCKIVVKLQNDLVRPATVEGYALGTLFVHKGINEHADVWWVTHKPSGVRFAWMRILDDAKRMGEVISDRCGVALARDTKPEILEAMPKSVTDWMSICIERRKFLPPPEVDDAAVQ